MRAAPNTASKNATVGRAYIITKPANQSAAATNSSNIVMAISNDITSLVYFLDRYNKLIHL